MVADVLTAGSQIMSGRAQARAMATEAGQYETQARDTDLQALQMSERRREDYRAGVEAVQALRAARGVSLDSPTAIAIEKELRRQAVRDEGVERLGYLNQSSALRSASKARLKGASSAIMASYLGAAGSLWSGAQNAYAAGSGGKKG